MWQLWSENGLVIVLSCLCVVFLSAIFLFYLMLFYCVCVLLFIHSCLSYVVLINPVCPSFHPFFLAKVAYYFVILFINGANTVVSPFLRWATVEILLSSLYLNITPQLYVLFVHIVLSICFCCCCHCDWLSSFRGMRHVTGW